ncbi:phosphoenolpyruvate mutase [Streptacidiphilus sp. EB129]|uniref:phosphoenolpyruvate mutase n=1 Tax=Streptacidiphilus sp. EB129 TaxID=3156262 RepID=UPI0035163F01
MHPVTSDARRAQLRRLIATGECVRIMEAHNPVSAIVAERAAAVPVRGGGAGAGGVGSAFGRVGGQGVGGDLGPVAGRGAGAVRFDGFWSSSLTDSTLHGLPDIEVLDIRSRLRNIGDIFAVTSKPLIMDGDTGGHPAHFEYHVRDMERAGVSAVIIEDKTGLKRNSLLGSEVLQVSAGIEEFSDKIRRGKAAQATPDFMVIARIESLILDLGMRDALRRADAYVAAGADGIMIHSRRESPSEVLEFAAEFRRSHPGVALVSVPTTYNAIHADDLRRAGFNVVIYANHLLRAALKAMQEVSEEILRNGRTAEVEDRCLDLKQILDLPAGAGPDAAAEAGTEAEAGAGDPAPRTLEAA